MVGQGHRLGGGAIRRQPGQADEIPMIKPTHNDYALQARSDFLLQDTPTSSLPLSAHSNPHHPDNHSLIRRL